VRILVDTNVLSELTKGVPDPQVIQWLRQREQDLVVNPVILGEIEYGILSMPPGRRRISMESWFNRVINTMGVIDFDKESAAAWARLLTKLKKKGLAMPVKDSLIAATAICHKLELATRNTVDFKFTGLKLVNPFSDAK